MNSIKKIFVGTAMAAGMVLAADQASAQSSATTSANGTATIVKPIAIVKAADLLFGKVVPGTATGTVVMTAAGARSATGGATLFGQASTSNAASFTVSGENSATYAITLPSAAVTLTSGVNTMTVGTFTSSPSATGALDVTSGNQTLNVGGTLNVGANQAAGSYTGSFSVTVAYN